KEHRARARQEVALEILADRSQKPPPAIEARRDLEREVAQVLRVRRYLTCQHELDAGLLGSIERNVEGGVGADLADSGDEALFRYLPAEVIERDAVRNDFDGKPARWTSAPLGFRNTIEVGPRTIDRECLRRIERRRRVERREDARSGARQVAPEIH